MRDKKILILGANGQIGTELADSLREKYGTTHIITADLKAADESEGPHEIIDVLDKERLLEVVKKHSINEIYHLAAMLSATGEKNPQAAWQVNMEGLINVLELAKEQKIEKIFWPSSIAVFGPHSPKQNTPQYTVMDPDTIYGISKLAGERLCEYYYQKYNLDIRSLRYPGLISYKAQPGGGTTDYAVEIFYEAIKKNSYRCFLNENTRLPMMYMPDAIRGTIELMDAPAGHITVRSSYNIEGFSFSPKEIAEEIKAVKANFTIEYNPDYRQKIADSWPESIDDSCATRDWIWKPDYDLASMTKNMLENIEKKEKASV